MPLNWLHPAFSLSVCLLHSELKQAKSRINCILSSPLTDIARSFALMGDRWQQIVAIFKGPYCLSQCCLWKRWQPCNPLRIHTFLSRVPLVSVQAGRRAVCKCRVYYGERRVWLLQIYHYLLTITRLASQSASFWLEKLEGALKCGFKASVTLIFSHNVPALRTSTLGTLQSNGKYISVWRKLYKAPAESPVGIIACMPHKSWAWAFQLLLISSPCFPSAAASRNIIVGKKNQLNKLSFGYANIYLAVCICTLQMVHVQSHCHARRATSWNQPGRQLASKSCRVQTRGNRKVNFQLSS